MSTPAGAERGQASVELLGAVPALLLLGAILFQLFAVGYASVLAGSAAEAGALALAGGGDARAAVGDALPGWREPRLRTTVSGGEVTVRLRPPALLAAVGRALEVESSARVAAP